MHERERFARAQWSWRRGIAAARREVVGSEPVRRMDEPKSIALGGIGGARRDGGVEYRHTRVTCLVFPRAKQRGRRAVGALCWGESGRSAGSVARRGDRLRAVVELGGSAAARGCGGRGGRQHKQRSRGAGAGGAAWWAMDMRCAGRRDNVARASATPRGGRMQVGCLESGRCRTCRARERVEGQRLLLLPLRPSTGRWSSSPAGICCVSPPGRRALDEWERSGWTSRLLCRGMWASIAAAHPRWCWLPLCAASLARSGSGCRCGLLRDVSLGCARWCR